MLAKPPQLELAKLSDGELMEAVRSSRDQAAYAVLRARYHPETLAYCRARLPDKSDADDADQLTWVTVWEKPNYEPQPGKSFRNWLFTLAHNHCESVRRKKRGQSLDLVDPPIPAPNPWIELLCECLPLLKSGIASLPSQQRCVVEATLAGQKTGEAAAACNCTPAQASVAKHRAIATLRAWIAEKLT